jgi:hypothetical protein
MLLAVISVMFIYSIYDYRVKKAQSYTGFVYTLDAIYYVNEGKPCKLA